MRSSTSSVPIGLPDDKIGRIESPRGLIAYYVVIQRELESFASATQYDVARRIHSTFTEGILRLDTNGFYIVRQLTGTSRYEFRTPGNDRLLGGQVGSHNERPLIVFSASRNHARISSWVGPTVMPSTGSLLTITAPRIDVPPQPTPALPVQRDLQAREHSVVTRSRSAKRVGIKNVLRHVQRVASRAIQGEYRVTLDITRISSDHFEGTRTPSAAVKRSVIVSNSIASWYAKTNSALHPSLIWHVPANPMTSAVTGVLIQAKLSRSVDNQRLLQSTAQAAHELRGVCPAFNLLRQINALLLYPNLIKDMAIHGLPPGPVRTYAVSWMPQMALAVQVGITAFTLKHSSQHKLTAAVLVTSYAAITSFILNSVTSLMSEGTAFIISQAAMFISAFSFSYIGVEANTPRSLAIRFAAIQGGYVLMSSILPQLAHSYLASSYPSYEIAILSKDKIDTSYSAKRFFIYIVAPIAMTSILYFIFEAQLSIALYLSLSLLFCHLLYQPMHKSILNEMSLHALVNSINKDFNKRNTYKPEVLLELIKRNLNTYPETFHADDAMLRMVMRIVAAKSNVDSTELAEVQQKLIDRVHPNAYEEIVEKLKDNSDAQQSLINMFSKALQLASYKSTYDCQNDIIQARLYDLQKEQDKAFHSLMKAVKTTECQSKASILLAEKYLDKGDIKEALVWYRQGNTTSHKAGLCQQYIKLEDITNATEYCRSALANTTGELDTLEHAKALWALYRAFLLDGDRDSRFKLVSEYPDHTGLLITHAYSLLEERDASACLLADRISAAETRPAAAELMLDKSAKDLQGLCTAIAEDSTYIHTIF